MALKNFTQFTPQTLLSATDFMVGYRQLDEIRTDLDSMSLGVSALLISKGFLPGTSVGRIKRVGFVYTIGSSSNLNAVSGTDDNGLTLSYTPNQIEVYRNGSHLANNLDFTATNSTQVTNLSTLNLGDVVEVVGLSGVGATIQVSLSGFINSLVQKNYRYSVATGNTIAPAATLISGSDDYNSVLNFNTNSFQVYLNGSHLVRDYDYTSYNSGTAFTLASPVANGDSIDVISLSSVSITSLSSLSAFSGINKILAGDRIAISSSTGNVTVSSQTCISDILVPSWTNANHISQFSLLQNYLSAVAASNTSPASAVYVQYISHPSVGVGTGAHEGGVLAPNGKIYICPDLSSQILIVDPSTDTITSLQIPGFSGLANEYTGMVLHPNGRIYMIPGFNTLVRVIDPSSNTISSIATVIIAGTRPSQPGNYGGVVAPNGKIYFVPFRNTICQVLDPSNNTIASFGTFNVGLGTSHGGAGVNGVLAPNGKIYFPQASSTCALVIDPSTNSIISTIVQPSSLSSKNSLVLAPNGNLYYMGGNSINAYIDPSSDTIVVFTTFILPSGTGFIFGKLAPNGKIYSDAYTTSCLMIIDPSNNTVSTIPFPGVVSGYPGGVLAPNGKIYLASHNATSMAVLNFNTNNNWNINVATNPMFNKN